ncbi:YSC84-related protein [Aestuariibacter sp. AA17]|uniref:YSC84-related protein n=1 Tax=Fluctibacter corallii TaxID=2984329 RepID=A0ABT3A990_9ALTE|nr:YSC84-related protein [Aestuariibacter sp. AA17]MCV2884842.1 YSC84-related protein [Aestuariibacter sp. AA17]
MVKNAFVYLFIVIVVASCASMGTGSNADKRQAILEMKEDVLSKLFKLKPDTRPQLASAAGYATFSNANINLLLVSAGTGYGVVRNKRTGHFTYMNMAEGGIGLGIGAKDYRIVMVFHTENALDHFVNNGWTFGGNADAAAKAANRGASIEGEAYYGDVSVYTFTESGLALQATIKGTKFWKDDELN